MTALRRGKRTHSLGKRQGRPKCVRPEAIPGINKRQYSVRAQQDGGFRGERASHDADANFADLVR
jgi:hypothetical protein